MGDTWDEFSAQTEEELMAILCPELPEEGDGEIRVSRRVAAAVVLLDRRNKYIERANQYTRKIEEFMPDGVAKVEG